MTKQEAKEFIVQSIKDDVDVAKIADAIRALDQEPCEDAIGRQAVLDIVNNPLNIRLDEIIKKLPPVTAIKDNCINRSRCKGCKYFNTDTIRCIFTDIPETWELNNGHF